MTYPTMTAADQRSAADTLRAIVAKEQSKKERRKKVRSALEDLIAALVKTSIRWLSCGWAFMLAVQVAHEQWIPALPGIGYWWAVLFIALLRSALTAGLAGYDQVDRLAKAVWGS